MSSVPSSPSFGASGSVESTVQREMRRRKLLVGLFLILLLVPVGVAAVFLYAGNRSSAAQPVAADNAGPTDNAVAALQREVAEAKSLAQGNQASLQQISSSQTKQAQQVQALRGDLQQTQAAVQRVQALPPPPPPPQSPNQNAALQQDVAALRAQVSALTERVQQVQQQNADLQKQVTTINRRVEIQPIRPQ